MPEGVDFSRCRSRGVCPRCHEQRVGGLEVAGTSPRSRSCGCCPLWPGEGSRLGGRAASSDAAHPPAGGMILSIVHSTYQLGMFVQAGGPDG